MHTPIFIIIFKPIKSVCLYFQKFGNHCTPPQITEQVLFPWQSFSIIYNPSTTDLQTFRNMKSTAHNIYSVMKRHRPVGLEVTCMWDKIFFVSAITCYFFVTRGMQSRGIRNIREDAHFHTAGIFIRDTVCFHSYSMNCDL